MISLEVHVCDQRRSYIARFATAAQAIEFMDRRLPSSGSYELDPEAYPYGNHCFEELEDEPLTPFGPRQEGVDELLDRLYPTCHHGLSADLCMDPTGPNHFGTREQELAGLL